MTRHGRRCTFCGMAHHNRRDYDECRARGGAPEQQDKRPVLERRPGAPTTRYDVDPLKGDKRAHRIIKKYRDGMAPRKIAKHYGVPLAEVERVIALAPK